MSGHRNPNEPAGDARAAGTPAKKATAPRRWPWVVLSLVVALPLAALGALAWVATTAPGTAWLLARVPGLTITAPQGSLIGDFGAERLTLALPGGEDRIVVDGLSWQGLALSRAHAAPAWLRIEAGALHAARVDLQLASSAGAARAPQDLALPVELALQALSIDELVAPQLVGAQPVRTLRARVELGAEGGALHRIDALAFTWDRVAVQGAAQIGTAAPLMVSAGLAVESRAGDAADDMLAKTPFAASAALHGPLERLDLQATLRSASPPAARRGAALPELDARATLAPFAAWPLAALELRTQALDLAALHSAAPGTALDGTARLHSSAPDSPASIAITLANTRAGRIDAGLLPLRTLSADLRARPDDPARGEIHALDLALGSAREAGGRLQGSGRWAPGEVRIDARLTELAPRVLDARAAALRVSGQATLAVAQAADGSAPAVASLRGRFSGGLPADGRLRALSLELDGEASAQHVELRRARLVSGPTSVSLHGRAQRSGAGAWQVSGNAALEDFDPALWWPGREGSAWRKGPHRIDATLALQGLLPRSASGSALDRLARAQGQASLQIAPGSMLGGQAVDGEISLRGDAQAATPGAVVEARVAVGGSALALHGRLAADGADRWSVESRGADLAPWSALAALAAQAGGAAPRVAGKLDATLAIEGRWPRVTTQGTLALDALRAGTALGVDRLALRWSASSLSPQAPLALQADFEGLDLGLQKIDRMRLRIDGSAAAHRIALDGTTPARPPRWLDLLHGADSAPGTGTRAELQAEGALDIDPAWQRPLRWLGQLNTLQLHRAATGTAPAGAWLEVAPTSFAFAFDPLTGLPEAALGPGRARLPNLALSWRTARVAGTAGAPKIELDAEVEPYRLAPLLARLQPDFGWGGDLVVAGRVKLRSAPTLAAELELGRVSGDLSVTDETGVQPLELTDLRLGLDARDGVWHFTQALAGRSLGALGGAVSVRTDPQALWPPADAPLQGGMELQVANLAAWGAWTPPGWRLQGRVQASASFGGSFGAPQYTGRIDGRDLALRNFLEGVDLRDGELDIALEGETARIRKLQARAGEGSVSVDGEALFGAAPRLQLRLLAERMRLLGRVDRRVVVSGDAALTLQREALKLRGSFAIDEGLIDISRGTAPQLGDDVKVTRGPAPEQAPEPALPVRNRVRSVDMSVRVDLGRALRLRGRGLDTRLEGDLVFSAPDGRLALNGTVFAVQGTYAAYNQKLAIERGAITFSGPLDNPRLDVLAVRPNVDVRVGVAITGSTRQPRVALFSDPDMSDNAKLSWLVLGRPPEETSGGDTALLQAAAMAILAGEGDGAAAQLQRLNPLDTFSVRQTDGAVRDTVLTVGKQLSQRWYIGYERVLSQTSGNWQLIYRLGQRLTVRLQTGIDNAIDVIWSWRWD